MSEARTPVPTVIIDPNMGYIDPTGMTGPIGRSLFKKKETQITMAPRKKMAKSPLMMGDIIGALGILLVFFIALLAVIWLADWLSQR